MKKNPVKLTDHPNACNSLTNFVCKSNPLETEKYVNLLKFAWKSCEMTSMDIILWRVLAFWNHCVLYSLHCILAPSFSPQWEAGYGVYMNHVKFMFLTKSPIFN